MHLPVRKKRFGLKEYINFRAIPSSLSVLVGTNNRNGQGGTVYKVSQAFTHENWDPYNLKNDVALVQVAEDIKMGENVQEIALNKDDIGGDESLVLSGWGRDGYPGNTPARLQFINLVSLSVQDCKKKQSSSAPSVSETQICTFTKRGEGACHGDSGGPLAYKGKVAGIVSWGMPCAIGYPDVFTRVSSFADWIEQHMD